MEILFELKPLGETVPSTIQGVVSYVLEKRDFSSKFCRDSNVCKLCDFVIPLLHAKREPSKWMILTSFDSLNSTTRTETNTTWSLILTKQKFFSSIFVSTLHKLPIRSLLWQKNFWILNWRTAVGVMKRRYTPLNRLRMHMCVLYFLTNATHGVSISRIIGKT